MLRIKPTGRQESHDGTVSLATATLAVAVECSFLLALGAAAPAAHDADLKVISTVARTPTLDELTPKYESSSGNKLMLVYSTIADLKKRIDAGETADVMILSRPFLDGLQSQGKVAQGSIVHVGSSYVAIGVRTGVPKPDISTAEKLKAARHCRSDEIQDCPGARCRSGRPSRKRRSRNGRRTGLGNCRGPGAQVVGPLPGDLNSAIVFAAGIGSTCKDRTAAKSLIELLTGPTGAAVPCVPFSRRSSA